MQNGLEFNHAGDGVMPLFYAKPEALSSARHGSLRLAERSGFAFARSAHAIPLVASEMAAALRSYPIVFAGQDKIPVAVTGLRRNQNLFVGSEGAWCAPNYVPAYVRRYPFILATDTRDQGRLALCVDRASERVIDPSSHAGNAERPTVPLFIDMVPTLATRSALLFCNQYQVDFAATQEMVRQIDSLGLLAPRLNTVTLAHGETLNLTDFFVVDETALRGIDDTTFTSLRRSGALALVYFHLASMNSWSSLLHQANAAGP